MNNVVYHVVVIMIAIVIVIVNFGDCDCEFGDLVIVNLVIGVVIM